jgi:DNA-binding response OmpR family regulator
VGGDTAFHRQGTRLLLQFEEFSLDLRRRELRREGDLLTLEPKVFDLLVFLVENRDRVVTRDELITHVWNGRIVSESALATCINASRSALNDSGEQQRLIKTLPRRASGSSGTSGSRSRQRLSYRTTKRSRPRFRTSLR